MLLWGKKLLHAQYVTKESRAILSSTTRVIRSLLTSFLHFNATNSVA